MDSQPTAPAQPDPLATLAACVASIERQAGIARTTLPHLAAAQSTRPGWLAALDVATDAGDLEHLVDLATQAPTEFALGMVGERVAAVGGSGFREQASGDSPAG